MFHSNTELLIDCWRAQAGPRGVLPRAALDIRPFAALAPQLVIVGLRPPGSFPFRLVGGLVADLYGRRLVGEDLLSLFGLASRTELRPTLETARRGRTTLVAVATGRTLSGQTADLQLLFAPMAGPNGQVDRFLGLYQPIEPLVRLRGERLSEITLKSLHPGETDIPRLRLAALNGRQIA